ncbi:hypothetical protein HPB51_012711 [Rhipicephalus microplus]|uniref:Uncharacterized protein n=1 Tax=Rhipicephalus microplus TaxID=6941 RepID=A0A9J6D573_RHIMP|nr:hypothetical protein HPB51_012711 [Rhipicephalus microplus]
MIQRTSVLRAVNMGLFFMSSKLVLFLCFVTFALLGNTLTSECVFVSMSLFNSLRLAMTLYFPFGVGQGAETLISVKRLQVIFSRQAAFRNDMNAVKRALKYRVTIVLLRKIPK